MRWLLVLLAAVAALGAGLAIRANEPASPTKVVNSYLDAVERQDTHSAYGQLCAAFKKAVPFATFDKQSRSDSFGVTGHQLARVQNKPGNRRVASYTVRHGATDTVIDAALVREGGHWKLCGFQARPIDGDEVPVPPGFSDTGLTTTTR